MRSDWVIPLCTGAERLKDADGRQGASDAEARGAAAPGAGRLDPAGRRGARPVLRHRHHRRGGQAARAALHRHRARAGLHRGRRRRASPRCARSTPRAPRSPTPKRAEPRVAFGQLVERGLLRAGRAAALAERPALGARSAPTAALVAADVRGSIHQVGAALEGAPSCNGWTYWHVKRDGVSVPIDVLRQQVRAEMRRAAAAAAAEPASRPQRCSAFAHHATGSAACAGFRHGRQAPPVAAGRQRLRPPTRATSTRSVRWKCVKVWRTSPGVAPVGGERRARRRRRRGPVACPAGRACRRAVPAGGPGLHQHRRRRGAAPDRRCRGATA